MRRSELDHLVIACTDLAAGIEWVEARLGARAIPGGKHVAMGTHNALLKLGARAYLEIIAIDPDAEPPSRPRWFALDEPEMQAQLAKGPRLITWAIRSESVADACARVPDLGEIMSMSRGTLHWKIAVPETGALPWGGILPAAIQWNAGEGTRGRGASVRPAGGQRLRAGAAPTVAPCSGAWHQRHHGNVSRAENRRPGGSCAGPEDAGGHDSHARR